MTVDPAARVYAEWLRLTFVGMGFGLSALWVATL